jgi:hypothetical protein
LRAGVPIKHPFGERGYVPITLFHLYSYFANLGKSWQQRRLFMSEIPVIPVKQAFITIAGKAFIAVLLPNGQTGLVFP